MPKRAPQHALHTTDYRLWQELQAIKRQRAGSKSLRATVYFTPDFDLQQEQESGWAYPPASDILQ